MLTSPVARSSTGLRAVVSALLIYIHVRGYRLRCAPDGRTLVVSLPDRAAVDCGYAAPHGRPKGTTAATRRAVSSAVACHSLDLGLDGWEIWVHSAEDWTMAASGWSSRERGP